MRFPPEFLERLRDSLPISHIIGKRIPIKRFGREYHALCPFHTEKTPSFTLNDEKGFFHCFGCGAHGDIIGFIKDFEGLHYTQAVEKLAGEAGIALPVLTPALQEQEKKRHTLEDVMRQAAEWFRAQFQGSAGKEAREYLAKRGIAEASISQFGIGYAPAGYEEMKTALTKKGIPEKMLHEGGLLAKSDDGRSYDRFRGRIMFPIRSRTGKVIAFGGRILPQLAGKNSAKYLNSPETELFKKGETLFAYDSATRAVRSKDNNASAQNLIVAEGYLDVIALHQAGFTTAVAPLGTAVTEKQLELLWRASSEPVICLDGDSAGYKAMQRTALLALPLLKTGLSLRFAFLPKGEDPDSFIRNSGAGAMQKSIDTAKIWSEAVWEDACQQFGSASPEQKAALQAHLLKTAGLLQDKLLAQHVLAYFNDQMFGLRFQKKGKGKTGVAVKPASLPETGDVTSRLKPLEETIIAAVLLCPALLAEENYEEVLGQFHFSQELLDKLCPAVLEIASLHEALSSASLIASLQEQGFGETVSWLIRKENRLLPSLSGDDREDYVLLKQCFDTHYTSCQEQKLDQEIKQVEQMLGQDPSEDNLLKLQMLIHEQKEMLLKKYSHNS